MKRRVSERILVLIISMAVLLSSTGVYSVFAENYSDSVSSDSSTTVSSSSAAESENGAESQNATNSEPNIVSEGGSVEIEKLLGSGTVSDPYLISDAEDLFKMQDIVNDSSLKDKFFTLTDDIDLSNVSYSELKNNKVVPGTIVSVDKSKSEAVPSAVQFTLNGRNHKIFGLNITNTGSEAVAIFGYLSAKSTIKYIDFENISVSASYKNAVATSAIVLNNNGQFRNCNIKNVTINVESGLSKNINTKYSHGLAITESTGIVGVNKGTIADVTVKNASVSIQSGRNNVGIVAGNNSGSISNVKVSSSTVNTTDCDAIGAVAGANSGKIENSTVESLTANVSKKSNFGGIAGKNSGTIVSCVASGKATGSSLAGGIVGCATNANKSNVKDCYSFVKLEANSETGAVIANGESRCSGNIWSSETSGRKCAYDDGNTTGDFVRDTRFVIIEKNESKSISISSLGGKFGDISYVLDSTKDITFSGEGVTYNKTDDAVVLTADEADKTGYLTYTARIAVPAGYDSASVVSHKFNVVILTVPEGTNGDGLSEETALEISNGAELSMISAVPYAHFKLDKDIKMPDDWDSSFILTGSVNGNGHKLTASDKFCKAVYGKITNLDVTLCAKISTAFFGKASDAEISNINLTKSTGKDTNSFIGVVASKSETGAFLNSVSGKSVISNCFSNVPVYISKSNINSIAGFIGAVYGDDVTIKSCGVSASITSDYDKTFELCSAFIGKASENKNGTIDGCFATLYSDLTNYVLIGGGDKDVKVVNSIYASSNKDAVAAPEKNKNIDADKWMFAQGENGFVTGEGSKISIVLPSAVLNSGKTEPKNFKAMFDSKDLSVNLDGMTIKNGIAYIPVKVTKDGATVKNSSLVIVHKSTGLLAEISISNGIDKDSDGNYLINCGADFIYINNNFSDFCDKSFIITKDIDMSHVDFSTVGGSSAAFTGKIDGKGHKISGLKANEKSKAALFGTLDGAKVKNIVFESADVKSGGSYAGILAAQVIGETTISGISFNKCNVLADENYAGIVCGEVKDSIIKNIEISNCNVNALNCAGAVAGSAKSSNAETILVKNAVVKGNNSAGAFGEAGKTVIKSIEIKDSDFNAKQNAGGIIGTADEVKVTDADVTKSKITSSSESLGSAPCAGGIFGIGNGTVKDAVVESEIKASGNTAVAGGIVGEATGKTEIEDSKSCANVTGSEEVTKVVKGTGGIIGRVSAENFGDVCITNTNVSGSVTAADYAGGIIGSVVSLKADGKVIVNCVSAAQIKETSADEETTSGHIIGFVSDLSEKDISDSVSGVTFSSYASELGAYGNIKADKTYCDIDSSVNSSLKKVIDSKEETVVKVTNEQADKLGFEFNDEKGWKSDSEKRVAVVDSSENQVKLSAEKTGIVSIVGTYVLPEDEDIALDVHFDAESEIKVELEGEGTKESPYLITNASELEAISAYAGENAFFELTNDIIFTAEDFEFGGEFYNEGKGFTPIGTKDDPFKGVFNGNGYKISGIIISDVENAGLFGFVSDAEITDLKVKNAEISADKLAAVVVASAKDSKITDVSVEKSFATSKSDEGSAAAVAAFAEKTSFADVCVASTEINANSTSSGLSTACAGAICARALDITITKTEIAEDTKVVSDGTSAAFVGYCDTVKVTDSSTFAEVNGYDSAAMAGNVKGTLELYNVVLGGTVYSDKYSAGIAAKADTAIIAKNVFVSAKITGEGETAIVAAYADESVFCDSEDCDVEFENIVYSSYQNSSLPFASEKISVYQKAEYVSEIFDVNKVSPKDGDFLVIGKDAVILSDVLDYGFDLSKYDCEDVYSVPEGLVKYNSLKGTVSAVKTATEDAKLVMKYDNGLEAAVDIISIKGVTGNGTESNPYVIGSADALELLRIYPESSFVLNKDIELTENWIPVENFAGKLDGAGHEISGLIAKADNAGLFASVTGNATVKNITFADAVVEGKSSAGVVAASISDSAKIINVKVISSSIKATDYAAAIVGNVQSSNSKITSCSVTGCTVSAADAAGIAAYINGKAEISSSCVEATELKGKDAAGGIVALASAEKLVINACESSADVSAANAGGIVGSTEKIVKIADSKTEGTVNGTKAEGGIIGLADGSVSVTGSSAMAKLSGKAENTAEIVAKFVTRPEDNEQFAKNFADNTISGNYDEFEPALMQYQNLVPANKEEKEIVLKGSGKEDDPYVISSAADLANIPDSSTAYYVLDSDIVISEKDYSISINKDGETVYGVFSDGYKPIKNFAGIFDGNGHVIKGLYIDSDSDYVGLFANITANGKVKNLHVELLEKSAGLGYYGIKGNDYVGGIAGYCDSTKGIENCSVTGSVISGDHAVGGLVGGLASSKISNSFAMSEIKAQNKAGGLIGVTSGNSTVLNCFAACEVNAAGGSLIGSNNGELTLADVMVNGSSHGTGSIAVGENKGTIKATRVLIAGSNDDDKQSILSAQEAECVYSDKSTLGVSEEGIKSLTTSQLTSAKPEGLGAWTQAEGKYPVPVMADEYSNKMAASAATPSGEEKEEESIGNVSISYKLTNETGEKSMDSELVGVLVKSKVDGATVTSDFFTSCKAEAKDIDKLLVVTGGFYVDSNLPAGYEFKVSAKNSNGKTIHVSDAGEMGAYVECGADKDIKLEISIIKTETPWGLTSLWESLVR